MNFAEIEKLLETAQYCIVYFILGLISGFFISQIFPYDDHQSVINRSTTQLLVLCLLQISANGIVIYYIHKIATRIPFLFKFNDNYQSTLIQSIAGVNLAISFTLKELQSSFIHRIREFCRRLSGIPHAPFH